MIFFLKNLKSIKRNEGMTYVELIVVLSIFAVMSSVVIFNYGLFQSKVDIKNLANDIALKVVEAQKAAVGGKYNALASTSWKPSYGVYFDLATGANTGKQVFYSFVDINQGRTFDYGTYTCPLNECLEKISLTKGNTIEGITLTGQGTCGAVTNLTVVFTRPDLRANMSTNPATCTNITAAVLSIRSPRLSNSSVKLYASGRVQIN